MKKILVVVLCLICSTSYAWRFFDTQTMSDVPQPANFGQYANDPRYILIDKPATQFPKCDQQYWKVSGQSIIEMTAEEKAAVDAAREAARIASDRWSDFDGLVTKTRRDRLLQESDWTQTVDAPLSAEQKAAWATYRQQLRDLPETYASPSLVVWPQVATETANP